ncbi:hypothetical protein HNP84_008229 [Thermocatellispora tengchongensis]|uniref:C-deglycosylation enzyme beta subunit n=1 Tax=Thermocatellispora tengchongensis TaxID=1073253 RepID=A0A840PR79_9ACTN|nr:DUF6379 domain-containing protein [Thermocatellispora tengchongensis]MBB5138475.1 hypothetical protein [Thermocatellispora tengchongensis]
MATHNTLLGDDSLIPHPDGFAVALRIPWYRSLWLSAVSEIRVNVDGVEIAQDRMHAELNGRSFPVQALKEQWDTLWFMQDRLHVVVHRDRPLRPGERLDVDVTISMRILYMQIAPMTYVTNRVHGHRELTARAAA